MASFANPRGHDAGLLAAQDAWTKGEIFRIRPNILPAPRSLEERQWVNIAGSQCLEPEGFAVPPFESSFLLKLYLGPKNLESSMYLFCHSQRKG